MLIRKNGLKYVFDFIEKCGYNVFTLPKYAVFATIERFCAGFARVLALPRKSMDWNCFGEIGVLKNDDRNRILYPLS